MKVDNTEPQNENKNDGRSRCGSCHNDRIFRRAVIDRNNRIDAKAGPHIEKKSNTARKTEELKKEERHNKSDGKNNF